MTPGSAQGAQVEILNSEGKSIQGQPSGVGTIVFNGINNRLVLGPNATLNRATIRFNASGAVVEIGEGCVIKGDLIVNKGCAIRIGARTKFNKPCRVHAAENCSIVVGEDCLFANVRFRTSDSHAIIEVASGQRINPAADIVVGDRVWLAEGASLYKGVVIGSGSVVGAGSIVTKSVPENSLAVGVPARVQKSGITWSEKL